MVELFVKNESARKRLYRRPELQQLAERICAGEGVAQNVELSVLFCDDPFIQELNRNYRGKNKPTDVLSFSQEHVDTDTVRVLGDVVISLETVEQNCGGDPAAMKAEVRLLFCHGVLHLLGYDHATPAEREAMNEKQARYLNVSKEAAWRARTTPTRAGVVAASRHK